MKSGAPSAGLERRRNRASSQKRAVISMGGECIPRTTSQEFGNFLSLAVSKVLGLLTRRLKVPKITSKTEIKVTVNIRPGKLAEVTPTQRAAVKKFWTRLISQVQDEVKGER